MDNAPSILEQHHYTIESALNLYPFNLCFGLIKSKLANWAHTSACRQPSFIRPKEAR